MIHIRGTTMECSSLWVLSEYMYCGPSLIVVFYEFFLDKILGTTIECSILWVFSWYIIGTTLECSNLWVFYELGTNLEFRILSVCCHLPSFIIIRKWWFTIYRLDRHSNQSKIPYSQENDLVLFSVFCSFYIIKVDCHIVLRFL